MILSRVHLALDSAYTRAVESYHHEKVLGVKPEFLEVIYEFDVGQVLGVCADFVLTLDDEHAPVSQDPMGLIPGPEV